MPDVRTMVMVMSIMMVTTTTTMTAIFRSAADHMIVLERMMVAASAALQAHSRATAAAHMCHAHVKLRRLSWRRCSFESALHQWSSHHPPPFSSLATRIPCPAYSAPPSNL
eukprot:6181605-Pleurochrysis_carterae.AAC.2